MAAQGSPQDEVRDGVLRFIASAVLHNQAVAARVGLGASDGQVLSLLAVNGPMTAGSIARLTGLSTGSVTALLDRLEQGGWARRERDEQDRRKVLVVPDDAGRRRLAPHYAQYGELLHRAIERRGAAELAVIADFLVELTGVEGYVAPAPGAPDPGPAGS